MTRLQPGARAALLVCLGMAGCGGGDDQSDSSPGLAPAPPAAQRGDLLQNPPTLLKSYAPADLLAALGGSDVGKALVGLALSPSCSVDVYQLKFQTVGAKAESASASGALLIPNGTAANCSGPRPILLYAHGTS